MDTRFDFIKTRKELYDHIEKIPINMMQSLEIFYFGKLDDEASDNELSEMFLSTLTEYKQSLFQESVEKVYETTLKLLNSDSPLSDNYHMSDINCFINEEVKLSEKKIKGFFSRLNKEIEKSKSTKKELEINLKLKKKLENEAKRFELINYTKEILSLPVEHDSSEIGILRKDKFKCNNKSFAIAIYAEEKPYESALLLGYELVDFHLDTPQEEILDNILLIFKNNYFETPLEITVGHEHGKITNKCYYQVCVFLSKYLQKIMEPFSFTSLSGKKYIGLFQTTMNSHSIRNYTKKPNLTVWKDSVADGYIGVHSGMSVSDFSDHLKKSSMRDFLHYGDRMITNFVSLVQEREIPEFSWVIPSHFHAEEFKNEIFVTEILNWVEDYCYQNPMRKKALCLISEERGLGKTFFSKRLVNDPEYFIYDRNTLNAENFKIKPKARLIILDEIEFRECDRQMWKALVAGEETNIRTPYNNYKFDNGLPCIICTNSIGLLSKWYLDTDFNTQVVFVEITKYMGPKGTRPAEISQIEAFLSPDTLMKINEFKKKKEKILPIPFQLTEELLNKKRKKDKENISNNIQN